MCKWMSHSSFIILQIGPEQLSIQLLKLLQPLFVFQFLLQCQMRGMNAKCGLLSMHALWERASCGSSTSLNNGLYFVSKCAYLFEGQIVFTQYQSLMELEQEGAVRQDPYHSPRTKGQQQQRNFEIISNRGDVLIHIRINFFMFPR